MKTIVETSTKLSKYLLADDVVITATADMILQWVILLSLLSLI